MARPTAVANEDGVAVLEDAATALRGIYKNSDAAWVAGLRPEDELVQPLAGADGTGPSSHRGGGATSPRSGSDTDSDGEGVWMLWPSLLGAVAVAALTWRLVFFGHLVGFEFPPSEIAAWQTVREAASPLALLLPMIVPPLASALFTTALCVQVGAAADSFMAFCGVGLSALTLLGCVGAAVIVPRACPNGWASECNVPFVTHWVGSVMRALPPMLAAATVGPTLDALRPRQPLRHLWTLLLCLPPVALLAMIVDAWWTERPGEAFAVSAFVLQLLAWALLVFRCVRQRRFGLVPIAKLHAD